jgi:hypothetical protein
MVLMVVSMDRDKGCATEEAEVVAVSLLARILPSLPVLALMVVFGVGFVVVLIEVFVLVFVLVLVLRLVLVVGWV